MIRTLLVVPLLLAATAVCAQPVVFKDPVGDDRGPGTFVYPGDPGYVRGTFDITELRIEPKADVVEFSVAVNADVTDPWRLGTWSYQFPVVFIAAGEIGGDEDIPGLNVGFDMPGWDYAVLMSPQETGRLEREIGATAPALRDRLLLPVARRVEGRRLIVSVRRGDLPEGDHVRWGYQVAMVRNDGFPTRGNLLTRDVNELAGQHAFGGGRDDDCEPNVIDILAGAAQGEAGEAQAQYRILSDYGCDADGETVRRVALPLIPVP